MQTASEEERLALCSISMTELTWSQFPGLNSNSPFCEQLYTLPWDKPPLIPTVIAPVDKRMSPSKLRDPSLQTLASIPSADFQIFTDGSVLNGIGDGGAGLVVLSQDDLVQELHAPTGTHSCSFQTEKAALKEAIQLLSSVATWVSAIIICDCNSLVQAVSNANSADSSVIQLQASAAALAMSKSIVIVWAPDHCGLSGSELTDHQAKLGAAETLPNNSLESSTRRAFMRRICRPNPIQLKRLKVCTSFPDEQTETSFTKPERCWAESLPHPH